MDIEDIRKRLDVLGWDMLLIIMERLKLVMEVARQKQEKGNGIIHAPDREARIFERTEDHCGVLGLNPDFVKEIVSLLIAHAKAAECDVLNVDTFLRQDQIDPTDLRNDLLKLTMRTAKVYTNRYCEGEGAHAIRAYLLQERTLIQEAATVFNGAGRAVDLGCANGDITEVLGPLFTEVIGFDVSVDMVTAAQQRSSAGNTRFQQADLDKGVPLEDASVQFAVANFGSASEVSGALFAELQRILAPGGRAFLSFYNTESLLSAWYYPWPSTVRAHHNRFNNTVEVWIPGNVYTLHAVGKTVEEVQQEAAAESLTVRDIGTYPTVLSILPRFFFSSRFFGRAIEAATEIDLALASNGPHRGAYLTALVEKPL